MQSQDSGNNVVHNSGEHRLRLPTTSRQLKPLTAEQMSRINQFSFVPKQTSITNKIKSTSLITNRLLGTAALNTNRSRFAMASTSLSSVARIRPYPLIIPTKADENIPIVGSISTRLNFDSDSATTRSLSEQISQSSNRINVSSGEKESKKWDSVATSPISQSIDWNALSKEAELVKYKSQISQLEDKLEESNVKNSRLKIDYDLNVEKLSKDLLREKDKYIDLEKQLKFNEQKCDDVSSQLTNAREEFALEYDKYQKKLTELQKQNSTFAMDINDTKMENESIKLKHQTECIELQHKIETLESELNRFNREKDILAKHMEEVLALARGSEVVSNEYNKAKLEISRLENELKCYKDGAKLSEILKNEIQELKKFKEENIELKRENELLNDVENKNMILQEKLIGLETELKIAQSKSDSNVNMDVDYQNTRTRLNEWQDTLSTSSPSRVSEQIAALQSNEVALREQIGSIKSELNEMTSSKGQTECVLRSAQSELNEFKKKVNDQSEMIKKLNRKCLLFSKEKESYKRLISSYEHDVTIDINKVSQDRIASLETTVDDYKKFIEQLENELKQVKDQTKFNEYESEINELKNEISRLRSINAQMENINKSIVDSHHNANPLSQNIEQDIENYQRLIEENRKLTAKIEILETGNDENMSRKSEGSSKSATEVEKLKQKLISAEKRQQSIIDAFKKTSTDFREVCYILTGYRIDALKQNIYRLSHVYADSPNENLLFEWEADRTIKMLENSYSEKLTDLLHTYVAQHDSFPAFLASLTLDLFRKQTHVANATQLTF